MVVEVVFEVDGGGEVGVGWWGLVLVDKYYLGRRLRVGLGIGDVG